MRDTLLRDLDATLALLESIAEDRRLLAQLDEDTRQRLLIAAGRVSRPDRAAQRDLAKAFRRKDKDERRQADRARLDAAGIRQLRAQPVFPTPSPEELPPPPAEPAPGLHQPRRCYVCEQFYEQVHFFYDQLCVPCGDFNYAKRGATADLRGRVALVTGGRVKIGYQASILLLRAGARVIVSTRFPRDAVERYAREVDFADFADRLVVYGLDLRHTPSVELFARRLCETEPRLDFILHNACQTVRRPAGFYTHLLHAERQGSAGLGPQAARLLSAHESLRQEHGLSHPGAQPLGLIDAPGLSQLALLEEDHWRGGALFPEGELDADLQQLDLRTHNSWRARLEEVPTVELLEVQLVNAVAPFVLNAKLKPLMTRSPERDKHIVNVSAMEGQFYRRVKTDKHPHTNMAKAALNMMTRTSAPDFARDGVHMNSVDTGWVSEENPADRAARKREEHDFHPPLDVVDGAARICDPIFDGFNTGVHRYGLFFKDYRPTVW